MNFYHVNQITDDMLFETFEDVDVVERKGIGYCNCPCALDIETSSFYKGKSKQSIMYLWQLNLNGLCIYGRRWEELTNMMLRVSNLFELDNKFRLVIYVHNLAYEFQFMRKYFVWKEVFAREKRKPMQALTDLGIMFKCSYVLSGYSLKKVAENLQEHKIEKLPDFDYSKIRHSETELTEREMEYALNDVLIIEYYIREEIKRNGDITKIPLTQTGYVRRLVKNACYDSNNSNKYKSFRELMSMLTIEPDEYQQLKRAFQGGFTHANAYYSGEVLTQISSYDLSSAYPTVMVNEKFPMSKGALREVETEEQFQKYMDKYCCIFDIEFTNLMPITTIEHPLSSSKCYLKSGVIEDNGRIVSAERLVTTMTEIDYSYFHKFYTWDTKRVFNFHVYIRGYLPTKFVSTILELYESKTKLKGVEGKEVEYMHSKQLINSCYGMIVTDIAPDEITYITEVDEWESKKTSVNESMKSYNKKKQRFLFYPWGIYVTSYTRRNLFTAIYELGTDYVYSDTDSVKCKNHENHAEYFETFNEICKEKNRKACEYHKLDYNLTCPEDIKGKKHHLGLWDYEGTYKRFKTLGAKRYLIETDKGIELTVSGVNKKNAVPYMLELAKKENKDVFDLFSTDLIIPEGHTGKMIMTYIDEGISGTVIDFTGKECEYKERSAIHAEPTSYSFSISDAYLDYLMGIQDLKS